MAFADLYAKCPTAFTPQPFRRCDGVTGAIISPTKISDLEKIYKDDQQRWLMMKALLQEEFIGKSCGSRVNGMYEWLVANRRLDGTHKLTKTSINFGLTEIFPFFKGLVKNIWNNEYWTVTGATTTVPTPPAGVTGSDFYLEVKSQQNAPHDVNWFPAGLRVYISSHTAGGSKSDTQYLVLGASIGATTIGLWLKDQNSVPVGQYGPSTMHAPPLLGGVLRRGLPNVTPEQNYCAEIPGINTNQMKPYWLQYTRYSICEDEWFKKYIGHLKANNPLYDKFYHVESVEINRQIVEDFQRRHANAFWFNKPSNVNQTLELYPNLPQYTVYDGPTTDFWAEGKYVGRVADAVGIYWQLAECGRVKDLQGQKLNLNELLLALYKMRRIRQANGMEAKYVELWTDSVYANTLSQAFFALIKAEAQGTLVLNMDANTKCTDGPFGFCYRTFIVNFPQGLEIRVVNHDFFDDNVEAHKLAGAGMETPGRMVAIIDWPTNYETVIETLSTTNRSGDVSDLAKVSADWMCVQRVPKKEQRLFSRGFGFVSECPGASLIMVNMSPDVPTITGPVGDYGDIYG